VRRAALLWLGFLGLSGCSSEGADWALPHVRVPQHPELAPNGRNNMHNDAYMSDTYELDGPAGLAPEVLSRSYAEGVNTCTTLVFDAADRVITTSASMLSFTILLVDPVSLESLAAYPLPPRDPFDPLFPYDDTSGAAYFALDRQGRILFSDAENAVQLVRYSDERQAFRQLARFDLSAHVAAREPPSRDHVQMAMPDWDGRHLWFTTRYGRVGTLEESSGQVRTHELTGEEIENSFAVGEDGVYVVSDHALYRFSAGPDGAPRVDWRTAYDRGTRVKPGNFNQGSGTTPHLFPDMVAIADNAEPRMNVLFVRRADGQVACQLPVFPEGLGTTENALPGLARRGPRGLEYSVLVDNNYGIRRDNILGEGRAWADHVGGLVRVDMLPEEGGGYRCAEVWASPERSSQVLPKISLSNGLVYLYTYQRRQDGEYDFFLTALDFATGQTRFSVPTGAGLEYANFGSPLALGPDGGAYLGTLGGLVKVMDGQAAPR